MKAYLKDIQGVLEPFAAASPGELERGKLQQRNTEKFLLLCGEVSNIMQGLEQDYSLLFAGDNRIARYRTLHFDTADLSLFHAHRRGIRLRKKIRIRHYDDRKLSVFEIKQRMHSMNTVKFSRKLEYGENLLHQDDLEWVERHTKIQSRLLPKVWTVFNRVILIHKQNSERFTVDFNLSFSEDENEIQLQRLAVIEVKQPRLCRNSPIMKKLREHKIHSAKFSKYCAAIAALYPNVRKNRLLPQLHKLERIEHE